MRSRTAAGAVSALLCAAALLLPPAGAAGQGPAREGPFVQRAAVAPTMPPGVPPPSDSEATRRRRQNATGVGAIVGGVAMLGYLVSEAGDAEGPGGLALILIGPVAVVVAAAAGALVGRGLSYLIWPP